ALLMEANSEVTEATKRIVEFCQWRCRDPRAWTNAHRSRLLRLIERQEETQKALSALILELLRKEEIFGDGPCPNMREGHLLGWHLCSRDTTMRVEITVKCQYNPNSKITQVPKTSLPINNEEVSDSDSVTAQPAQSPPLSPKSRIFSNIEQ
ncbi:unnamed protein product, partial [Oikopleura dioica]